MQGFQQTTQLLADMDKELSKVKGLQSHVPLNVKGEKSGDPQAAYRASLLGKVQEVTVLLNKSRARVAAMGEKNKTLGSQVADYQATITNLQAMLEQNKADLAALNLRVDSLTTVKHDARVVDCGDRRHGHRSPQGREYGVLCGRHEG